MYRKHEESPLGVYNSSKLSSATKAGQGEMEKPLGDVYYLIQSLLTVAMPPEAYPSKLQIATPASKTNIHTHKKLQNNNKKQGTTTAKMLQLKYTMSLCTEGN